MPASKRRAPASAEVAEAAPEISWDGPTKAEVQAHSRRAAQAQRAAALAAYRLANPEFRGSDAKMEALMQIEAIGNAGALTGSLEGRDEPGAANDRRRVAGRPTRAGDR